MRTTLSEHGYPKRHVTERGGRGATATIPQTGLGTYRREARQFVENRDGCSSDRVDTKRLAVAKGCSWVGVHLPAVSSTPRI